MRDLVFGVDRGGTSGWSADPGTVGSTSVTVLALVVLISVPPTRAQPALTAGPLSLSGQVGLAAEAYTSQGIAGRRAPASTQVFANTQFSLFGLRSGVNLLYSTDNSGLRQSMNRLAFSGEWRWLRVSLGDVSPTLTKYSLSGVTVRGGLVELTPGKFIVTFTGGRSQRAVAPSTSSTFSRPTFAQWLYAARLGIGAKSGTHFHMIGVMGREQIGSLDQPGSLTPAENLSLTPDFGLTLFQGRFTLQAHATAVVYTHDTRTAEIDVPGLPLPSSPLFRPRKGSRINYAGQVEAQLRLDEFSLRGGYERIEPGFQTLGAGYVISDQQIVTAAPSVNLLGRRLTIGGTFSWSRNNLLGQRLTTLTRMQWGTNVQARIGSALSVGAGYQQMDNANRPIADSLMSLFQDQLVQTFMVTPNLILRSGPLTHAITLSATYQRFAIRLLPFVPSPATSPDFDNVNTALTYSVTAPSGWTVSVSGTYLLSNTGATDLDAAGVTLGSGAALLRRKLLVNVSAGWSENWIHSVAVVPGAATSGSRQWMMNVNTSLQLTSRDGVRLNVRGLTSQLTGAHASFRELQTTLRYDHRF